ncbi:hypothetical protein [Nitrosomonas eutropha]|uniref:hypothetical protein n=1 Tax=Nitrosomonas eutropha TaxID=916 RepID=UPI0008B4E555|nr:hypothetical protein [Nitrosomonas eutropha]SEJ25729.1 hypothetical protein SAMN05216318_13618 [Nitrosomonas eutropha]
MNKIIDLEKLFHRSKERIKDLGEVFTPESSVTDMLNLLTKGKRGLWSDEAIAFFEPCSGHGNIVLPIYKRRLEGIYKKAVAQGLSKTNDAPYYAVANTLNTLWAIDIDPKNVENCRSRVLSATLDFLKTKLEIKSDAILFSKKRDFFAHILSAIKWHIDENETLSALSNPENAKASANLTKAGAKWFSQNGHQPMDFDLSWVNFYESCEASKTIPLEYERSLRFIDAVLSGKLRGFDDYEFAKVVIEITKPQDTARKPARIAQSVGA